MPTQPSSPTPWGWASTPATTSTTRTSPVFRAVPHLDEVSIGHAIMAEAVFDGLPAVIERYLAILRAVTR